DGDVIAPGTVIISAGGNCTDITNVLEPVLRKEAGSIYYINLSNATFKLGGSSFAQVRNKIRNEAPTIQDAAYFKTAFNAIQQLITNGWVAAGHDVGSGGLITTLLELCFADTDLAAQYDLTALGETDTVKALFNENIAVVLQAMDDQAFEKHLANAGIIATRIGGPREGDEVIF